MRDEIHSKFGNVFDEWKLNEFKSMFSGPEQKEKWKRAMEYSRNLDEIRGQNISDYLQEF